MNIIGHKDIVTFLSRSIERENLVHAYLFAGPKGLGKTAVAEWFVLQIINEHALPVAHPDIMWIKREEDKKEISINTIRDFKSFITQKPSLLSQKIGVIEEVELLSMPASHAILKTLEEPPGESIIILIAHTPHRILKTIFSRCQHINFRLVPTKVIEHNLNELRIDNAAAIARAAQGRPGYALTLARDEGSEYGVLGNAIEHFALMSNYSIAEKFAYIASIIPDKKLAEQSIKAQKILFYWQTILRDILLLKSGLIGTITYSDFEKKIKNISKHFTHKQLILLLRCSQKIKEMIQQNVNPRLALENFVLLL